MHDQDTIVAISTPAGRGGIGIVRLSGPMARETAAPMLRLRRELAPGRARFGELVESGDPARERSAFSAGATPNSSAAIQDGDDVNRGVRVLDEVVATYFAAPNSYTGEDVVEIAMHGSPVLLEHVVRACCARGARLAEPGEFTQRAFLAGRIDLTQAEAVGDLIESSTLEQARVAARQMGGALARLIEPVKAELVALIAALEAGIDFADDDIDVIADAQILEKIVFARARLEDLERSFVYGRVVRDGFRLAIVGRPNAGKSSLFNRLVERERAIVTPAPGTTRDLVTERVAINGIPVEMVDTAGLRETYDEAERIGVAKSREAMADADLVLLVIDSVAGIAAEDEGVLEAAAGRNTIVAMNKTDLAHGPPGTRPEAGRTDVSVVQTSALTGEGIAELRAAILRSVAGEGEGLPESAMLTNVRQHQAVQQGLRGLEAATAAIHMGTPHEMLLLDLYESLRGLDALTGATSTEDVLRLIFSSFCIGK